MEDFEAANYSLITGHQKYSTHIIFGNMKCDTTINDKSKKVKEGDKWEPHQTL